MGPKFITRLPREAEGKDFRVLPEEGGYVEAVRDLEEKLRENPEAIFTITAQRDLDYQIFLSVRVTRGDFDRDRDLIRFDGVQGELLDLDGRPTGHCYQVSLSIDPTITYPGQTVGVLRMRRARCPQRHRHLPTAS